MLRDMKEELSTVAHEHDESHIGSMRTILDHKIHCHSGKSGQALQLRYGGHGGSRDYYSLVRTFCCPEGS